MFKIEHENPDFRKSLYFYIVDAEKKEKKALALYSKRLRGAGCIVDSKNGLRTLASALIYIYYI